MMNDGIRVAAGGGVQGIKSDKSVKRLSKAVEERGRRSRKAM